MPLIRLDELVLVPMKASKDGAPSLSGEGILPKEVSDLEGPVVIHF